MHERQHSGEALFSCSFCEKRFTTRAKLIKHEVQHTGETPYTCSYCGKTFNHQQTLSKHERTHTGCFVTSHTCTSLKIRRGIRPRERRGYEILKFFEIFRKNNDTLIYTILIIMIPVYTFSQKFSK